MRRRRSSNHKNRAIQRSSKPRSAWCALRLIGCSPRPWSLRRCSPAALGARRYAAGQPLTVRTVGGWRDADVATAGADGLCHQLTFLWGSSGEPPATLTLHPWNHAPRELPHAAFEALSGWWTRELRQQHSQIFDALTGKRLDALQQCVAIEVMGDADLAGVHDVRGLSDWLHSLHASRSRGEAITAPGAALLTAPPAAGKTTLISQAVVLALDRAELVPIVIKVQLLQARLRDAPDAFASHWNWVDAYLCLTYAERPEVYRMLRQAMMARRALLLLDGLDEAGAKRAEIEQHIVEVLAPQGHVMLCTSRPAGVDEARFAGFRLLKLAPLTEAQQEQALLQRLGNEGDVRQLMAFVERMPTSTDPAAPTMQHRVTAIPLMLSMVASVFEIRKGLGMPKTVAELYASASDAMLARGGVVTAEVRTLLEAVFFEAHVAQARVITDVQLLRAALGAFAPAGTLADLDVDVVYPFHTFKGRLEVGHYVELLDGERKGQRGEIVEIDESSNTCKVKLADGVTTGWLEPKRLGAASNPYGFGARPAATSLERRRPAAAERAAAKKAAAEKAAADKAAADKAAAEKRAAEKAAAEKAAAEKAAAEKAAAEKAAAEKAAAEKAAAEKAAAERAAAEKAAAEKAAAEKAAAEKAAAERAAAEKAAAEKAAAEKAAAEKAAAERAAAERAAAEKAAAEKVQRRVAARREANLLQEERDAIRRLDSTEIPEGGTWFLVDAAWLKHWRDYCWDGIRPDPPGPICNSRLLRSDGRPHPNLQKATDYRGVNEAVWRFHHGKYGGGPAICRSKLDIYAPPIPPPADLATPTTSPQAVVLETDDVEIQLEDVRCFEHERLNRSLGPAPWRTHRMGIDERSMISWDFLIEAKAAVEAKVAVEAKAKAGVEAKVAPTKAAFRVPPAVCLAPSAPPPPPAATHAAAAAAPPVVAQSMGKVHSTRLGKPTAEAKAAVEAKAKAGVEAKVAVEHVAQALGGRDGGGDRGGDGGGESEGGEGGEGCGDSRGDGGGDGGGAAGRTPSCCAFGAGSLTFAPRLQRMVLPALEGAVQALRDEERAAVAQVRERVLQDRLPLLSLLQVEPLEMQSSHLSFQEYFAARAICTGKYHLPEGSPPPWQWPAFWANAVTLGSEMGDAFGKGLKRTAGVGDVLDLSQKLIGGDRPTMVAVVAQLMRGLASLSLRENKLTDGEGLKMFAALQTNTTLTQLDLGGNELGAESGKAMADALKTNTTLTQLSLKNNKLGDAGGCALAVALQANTTLAQLDLGGNKLGAKSGKALAVALKTNTTLKHLGMGSNSLGADGSNALVAVWKVNRMLTQLDLG